MKIFFHILIRIVGIVLLSKIIHLICFDGESSGGMFGDITEITIILSVAFSFIVSVLYLFVEAYVYKRRNLKSKSQASLNLGFVLFLILFISFVWLTGSIGKYK